MSEMFVTNRYEVYKSVWFVLVIFFFVVHMLVGSFDSSNMEIFISLVVLVIIPFGFDNLWLTTFIYWDLTLQMVRWLYVF